MTRDDFIAKLRQGLAGLPEAARAEIVADYESHFADGVRAGRSEADIAAALGDPGRLARELRAEAGLKRWETERNPEAAAAAVFAVLGLGAIDVLVLMPILIGVVSVLFAFALMSIGGFVVGAFVFGASPFGHDPAGPLTGLLFGLGLMALSVTIGSIITLLCVGLVNGLVWYGRLHYRLLKPAIEPQQPVAREVAAS
ncbi:MAG TPA: DUF1700 domain-containing protein [Caulobacteraceae bacterium]|nr:DUF1700 domain-containing protein [Caulobacteraceae bacterium]